MVIGGSARRYLAERCIRFGIFCVILEDFYNLFIYKRFERKVKIEVTNWQLCLFLRFAVSCCQCHSS